MDSPAEPAVPDDRDSGTADPVGEAVRRLLEEDPEGSFDRAFALYRGRLWSFCRSCVGASDADELFHETYERGKRNVTQLRNKSRFYAWLKVIARNHGTWMRAQRDRQAPQDPTGAKPSSVSEAADPADHAETVSRAETVRMVMRTMRETHPEWAEALALQAEGLSYREIADIQQIAVNSVGPRLTKAKREFLRLYEGGVNQ